VGTSRTKASGKSLTKPTLRTKAAKKLDQKFAHARMPKKTNKAAGPYAIKKQRTKRDEKHASKPPVRGSVQVLRAEPLENIPWLVHGFSTRIGGVSSEYGGNSLNLGMTKEEARENFEQNLTLWKSAVVGSEQKANSTTLKSMRQIHSAIIHRINTKDDKPEAGDGLITNVPGVLLSVKTADCLPVIVVDPVRHAVGVFHAGWRGTVQRIVEKGVGEMRKHFSSDPADLLAAIGPGIGRCCYQVGDEVVDKFDSQFAYSRELFEEVFDSHALHVKYPLLFLNQRAPGHGEPATSPHLDLAKANRYQLRDAGVRDSNISTLDYCTSCRTDLFFSYRKERVTGRMMATVGIRG
jgi:polyphenol oxidase